MIAVLWLTEKCAICEGAFNEDSWDARHSGHHGEDIHWQCCFTHGPCSEEESEHE